jgi:hypothetical protein
MHSKYLDLARDGVAWRDTDAPPSDDALSAARGIILACIVAVPCWALIAMLGTLAYRWVFA